MEVYVFGCKVSGSPRTSVNQHSSRGSKRCHHERERRQHQDGGVRMEVYVFGCKVSGSPRTCLMR